MALTLSFVAALAACTAGSPELAAVGDSSLTEEGTSDAMDSEADAEGPERRRELARLLAEHADPPGPVDEAADRDADGIADALEEELLRRYRPFYRFSKTDERHCASKDESSTCRYGEAHDEAYRPADPVEQIRHGRLATLNRDGEGATLLAGCGRPGDGLLVPEGSLFACKPDASLLALRKKTNACITIDEAQRGGTSLDDAMAKATGLIGHVAPDVVEGHPAYKIEYWQFFAFNNQDITVLGTGSYGDHDGDWTSVQVWFDRTLRRLTKIVYLIHGFPLTFNIPPSKPSCRRCRMPVKGARFNPNPGNFMNESDRRRFDDNLAEFYVDEHGFKHVAVYIEAGGHEFWPGAWGDAVIEAGPLQILLNPHNGRGTSYLVPAPRSRPFTVGEVERPLNDAARTLLAFNGFWGCTNDRDLLGPLRRSPPGPAVHCSWKWPSGSEVEGCEP